MLLNTENAKAFNASLKKLVSELIGQKVKVEIINSYKFPDCWVRVYPETEFNNDFKLKVFEGCNYDKKGLLNPNNVSYGNIQSGYISAYVKDWINILN